MKVNVNEHGTNKAITATVLSDEQMREIGFTDKDPDVWYFARALESVMPSSFNVTIPKNRPKGVAIEVLDEEWLQPYDYQAILEKRPDCLPALAVKTEVEKWMRYLADAGVLSGHKYGDYI